MCVCGCLRVLHDLPSLFLYGRAFSSSLFVHLESASPWQDVAVGVVSPTVVFVFPRLQSCAAMLVWTPRIRLYVCSLLLLLLLLFFVVFCFACSLFRI